jgi:hypothetical protein
MESPHKGKTGLRRVWNAFFYSPVVWLLALLG